MAAPLTGPDAQPGFIQLSSRRIRTGGRRARGYPTHLPDLEDGTLAAVLGPQPEVRAKRGAARTTAPSATATTQLRWYMGHPRCWLKPLAVALKVSCAYNVLADRRGWEHGQRLGVRVGAYTHGIEIFTGAGTFFTFPTPPEINSLLRIDMINVAHRGLNDNMWREKY